MAKSDYQSFEQIGKGIMYMVASIFLLIASIGVFQLIGDGPWYKNVRAEVTNQPYARTITVSGEGKITARPDVAVISLSVVSTGETVAEVSEDSNSKISGIIASLKEMGIDEEDVRTSNYDLFPQYNRQERRILDNGVEEDDEPRIVGYRLNQSLEVKMRDLTMVDQVIDQATRLGANQVGSLRFEIDDAGEIKSEAREIAFDEAEEKARAMASAAGVSLGRVVTFSEGFGDFPRPLANFAMEARSMAEDAQVSAPSIEPGSQELNVTVSVTYEID